MQREHCFFVRKHGIEMDIEGLIGSGSMKNAAPIDAQ